MNDPGRWKIIFQSTFPRGERRGWIPDYNFDGTISIHVPTRGTTIVICIFYIVYAISIHVPTRGTTFAVRHYAIIIIISIHVPTRGTTIHSNRINCTVVISIPVPTRGTTVQDLDLFVAVHISIHVPTRGTTEQRQVHDAVKLFQSTFPRGERLLAKTNIQAYKNISIHVPTRGTTLLLQQSHRCSGNFNPRSHEGNDLRLNRSIV